MPSWVQIVHVFLSTAKPFSARMLAYCWRGPWKIILVKTLMKIIQFWLRKIYLKMTSVRLCPFSIGLNLLTLNRMAKRLDKISQSNTLLIYRCRDIDWCRDIDCSIGVRISIWPMDELMNDSQKNKQYIPRNIHTASALMPWCRPGSLTSSLQNLVAGKTFPAFPAHAQPAILRMGYEAHLSKERGLANRLCHKIQ